MLVFTSACDLDVADGSTATLTYTEDARLAYQEAMEAYNNKDWEDARALFEEVQQRFAQSRYARLAELRIADIAFIQEKYTDAIASYRDFMSSHRADRFVEYAKYRTAKALYLDIDDTLLLPPAEERDQAVTKEAYRELRGFLRQYPTTRYKREALYMLEVVTGRLARHELYVARYYLRSDVFDAAVARCDYTLRNYPGSGLDAEALVLKGETLMKMDRDEDARAVFQEVIKSYGGPFSVTAQAFLEELDSPTQSPPQITRPKQTTDPKRAPAPE
jgi:outer membrane protein assembly factor BamD